MSRESISFLSCALSILFSYGTGLSCNTCSINYHRMPDTINSCILNNPKGQTGTWAACNHLALEASARNHQHQRICRSKPPKHCQRLDIKSTSEPVGLWFEWCGDDTAHTVSPSLSQLRETGRSLSLRSLFKSDRLIRTGSQPRSSFPVRGGYTGKPLCASRQRESIVNTNK